MKTLAVIAVTKKGILLGNKIYEKYPEKIDRYTIKKLEQKGWNGEFGKLSFLLPHIFNKYKGFILIMSTGIAVRILAPLVKHKSCDPAVVVMDENNNYVISLLSGHLGGANGLAQEIGDLTGCQPVITTATDVNNLKAVDMLARQWQLPIEPLEHIKIFNKALLDGHSLNFWTEKGINIPQNIVESKNIELFSEDLPGFHVLITHRVWQQIKEKFIFLRPPSLVLGIGCRRNYPYKDLVEAVYNFFNERKISVKSISALATVELKAKEKALIYLANKLEVPINIYSREELAFCLQQNKNLSSSSFVKKNIGIGGVCEPAAILGANNNQLLVNKTKFAGLTLAVGIKKDYQFSLQKDSWFNN